MSEENSKQYAKDVGRLLLRLGEIRLLLASLSQRDGIAPDRLADTLGIMNELESLARNAKATLDRPWLDEPGEERASDAHSEADRGKPHTRAKRDGQTPRPGNGKIDRHSGATIAGITKRLRHDKADRKGSGDAPS